MRHKRKFTKPEKYIRPSNLRNGLSVLAGLANRVLPAAYLEIILPKYSSVPPQTASASFAGFIIIRVIICIKKTGYFNLIKYDF